VITEEVENIPDLLKFKTCYSYKYNEQAPSMKSECCPSEISAV